MAMGNPGVPVSFDKVAKSFGDVTVLQEFDIQIKPGEFLVLLGASGSGKTTALRILSGLETATSGRVRIGDRDVTDILAEVSRHLHGVPILCALPAQDGWRKHRLSAQGAPASKQRKWTWQSAKPHRRCSLKPSCIADPRELSGGQRQRVALARAIIRRPSVFLMDEPLSNLDAKLRGHMRAELKHMQENFGITTIYVTHDQIEAMTLAHRVAILEKGVLQQLATPSEIYNNPANLFVAQFIGSPPMNIVHGELQGDTFLAEGHKVNVPVKGKFDKAILGVRPEDCSVTAPNKGDVAGEIFTNELIGDHTLITVKTAKDMISVKAAKDYKGKTGEKIGVSFAKSGLFVFDGNGGARCADIMASGANSFQPHEVMWLERALVSMEHFFHAGPPFAGLARVKRHLHRVGNVPPLLHARRVLDLFHVCRYSLVPTYSQ